MAQYINKAAVIAEIRSLQVSTMDEYGNFYTAKAQAEYNILCMLEMFLDTLEVKEMDEEYNGKAMLHVLEKGVKQGKREMFDKAYGWINLHIGELSDIYTRSAIRIEFLDDFRKAMEE